uniref:Uncharacterized protein n=1 Tax=Oryza nivara TaxID=4536 RepID=A0A0E0GPK1_ORYNI
MHPIQRSAASSARRRSMAWHLAFQSRSFVCARSMASCSRSMDLKRSRSRASSAAL